MQKKKKLLIYCEHVNGAQAALCDVFTASEVTAWSELWYFKINK